MEYSRFDKCIQNAVSSDFRTSLLINGKWGCGKTWYVKNQLPSVLRSVNEEYNTIYISLYGIQSIKELSQRLRLSKYIKKNSRSITVIGSMGWGVLKDVADGYVETKTGASLTPLLDGMSELFSNLGENKFFTEKDVIVLDDLERLSEKINLEDILGFVSSNLIENSSANVILVANESEIKNDNYSRIKEKTIGITLDYKPDIDDVLNSLHGADYEITKNQLDVLKKALKTTHISNLRTIQGIFQKLKMISSKLEGNLLPENLGHIVLWSVLALENERSEGRMDRNSIPTYMKERINLIEQFRFKVGQDDEEKKESEFRKKYMSNTHIQYYFFESLYNLVCSGYLDFGYLKIEINELKETHFPKETEYIIALNNLTDILRKDEHEIIDNGRIIKNHINENQYSLKQLITILSHFDYHFHNYKINYSFSWQDLVQLITEKIPLSHLSDSRKEGEYFRHYSSRDIYSNDFREVLDIAVKRFKSEMQLIRSREVDKLISQLNEDISPLEMDFISVMLRLSDYDISKVCDYFIRSGQNRDELYRWFIEEHNRIKDWIEDELISKNRFTLLLETLEQETSPNSMSRYVAEKDIKAIFEEILK